MTYTTQNTTPTGCVELDYPLLAEALRMMTRADVPGLHLRQRDMRWNACITRNKVRYQRTFGFTEKYKAVAWLICQRAELIGAGKYIDGRSKAARQAREAAHV
ncbi:hypothetical protein FAS41_27870 [Pseudomonas nicosulfuronedens]|uniref:Uncharacterized protein n=1 Tax=Pseudomonas nicosulfuronedens TaxID=2571105 RepID=A0A5R9QLS3_9PSED|nr:hypothetical protein [Pseudomonas nicosulfuronedens]TLX70486.1 hypothetical protein FAS41_27870 [Pseudomonas nicosulfuronedens]